MPRAAAGRLSRLRTARRQAEVRRAGVPGVPPPTSTGPEGVDGTGKRRPAQDHQRYPEALRAHLRVVLSRRQPPESRKIELTLCDACNERFPDPPYPVHGLTQLRHNRRGGSAALSVCLDGRPERRGSVAQSAVYGGVQALSLANGHCLVPLRRWPRLLHPLLRVTAFLRFQGQAHARRAWRCHRRRHWSVIS
jgi:hypothetical protein